MRNALLPGLGGPMGRHARAAGIWFNPIPWVILASTLVWMVVVLQNVPCVWVEQSNPVNTFIRLCYSDIQYTYVNQGFGRGEAVMGSAEHLNFLPVLGALVMVTVRVASLIGKPLYPAASQQEQIDNSVIFFAVTAVVLYLFLVAWVVCQCLMGRESRNGRYRSWDGLIVAVSPAVLCSGLVNWDLVPIGFCAIGLLLFARGSVASSAVILALAAGSGLLAFAVVLAVAAAIAMRGTLRHLVFFVGTFAVTWVAVHLPLLLTNAELLRNFYLGQINQEAGYGSIWFALGAFGWTPRQAGGIGFAIMLSALIITLGWLYVSGRRPRIGSLVGLTILWGTLTAAAFPSQTAMWVLLALVLARPHKPEVMAFSITQLLYYLALMGHLGGHLTAQRGPVNLYYLAILVRWGVEVWILVRIYLDMAMPRFDALRRPDHSDPIGGVLVDREESARLVRAA